MIFTVIIQLILSLLICVMLIFYSPFFKTVEKFIVSSAMESRTQQYIAKIFLSDDQIDALLNGSNSSNDDVTQTYTNFTNNNLGDSQIDSFAVGGSQFSGYILKIKDPLRVKVAMTQYPGKVGEFTSKIAERMDAVAAINGGGFQGGSNWSDSAQNPTNFVFHGGSVIWQEKNWSDNEKVNTIAIDNKGMLIVGKHSINELKELNVSEAVTLPSDNTSDFRPLIVNGKRQFSKGGSESRAPRTAIAQLEDGSMLLVVLDGRKGAQWGATYYELQELLLTKANFGSPVENATILDGGGSSTMYYNGEVVNNPSAAFGERTVATAFYVEK